MSGPGQNGGGGVGSQAEPTPTGLLSLSRRPNGRSSLAEMVNPSLDEQALCDWIALKGHPDRRAQQCTHFVLSSRGDRREVVTQESLPKGLKEPERGDAIAAIVSEFSRAARLWADESQYVSAFVVGGCFSDAEDAEEKYLWPFRIAPRPGNRLASRGDFGESVGSGPLGLRAEQAGGIAGALCRVIDTQISTMASGLQQDKDRFLDREEKLLDRLDKIEAARFEMRVQCEQLLDARVTREIEALRARFEIDREQKLWGMAEQVVVPVVMAVLQQKGLVPAQPAEHPLMSIAKSMNPKQVFLLYTTFSPEQRKMFDPVVPKLAEAMSPEQRAELQGLFLSGMPQQIEAPPQAAQAPETQATEPQQAEQPEEKKP